MSYFMHFMLIYALLAGKCLVPCPVSLFWAWKGASRRPFR